MRLRDREMPLDPEIERELEAIDRALAGEPVAADLADLAELARDLRAERAIPDPGLGAELDGWAAEGFPPAGRPRRGGEEEPGTDSALGRLWGRLTSQPPRRLLAPVGAAATLLVVLGVAIGVSDQIGGPGETPRTLSIQAAGEPSGSATDLPNAAPKRAAPSLAGGGTAGRAIERGAAGGVGFAGGGDRIQTFNALRDQAAAARPVLRPGQRKEVQRADLVLSSEPEDVRDVADGVVQVVDRYRGFVVSSSVTSGEGARSGPRPENGAIVPPLPGLPGATFQLKVPARNLQAALGDLSGLAHVSSRTENIEDITHRFNAAEERVSGLEGQRDRLLRQLGEAVTLEEQQSIKARLHIVEQQLAAARRDFAGVQQRIHLVPLNVQIVAQQGVDAGGGSWDIGDALHDAGRVLTVTGGILLVSVAVLGPLAILAALVWLGARAWRRWRREQALDERAA